MAQLNSKFGALANSLEGRAELVVEKIARDAEAEARMRSRIDTGAMVNAWHVKAPARHTRLVVNGVEYAIYNEMGTVRMSAQPMLIPAFQRQKPVFQKVISKLLEAP